MTNSVAYTVARLLVLMVAISMLLSKTATAQQILIDPGHSPLSPGATGCSGQKEYLYNQALANVVSKKLQEAGITTALTTSHKAESGLRERAAQSKGYDLLISLHHDSVQSRFATRNKQGGICSDKASGFSIFVSTKNPAYLQSLEYATRLAKALKERGLSPSLHHAEQISGEGRILLSKELGIYQYDDLQLLKGAASPALLLEAAVLVNRQDEARAATPAFKSLIADAVAEAVKHGAKQCSGTCKMPVLKLL